MYVFVEILGINIVQNQSQCCGRVEASIWLQHMINHINFPLVFDHWISYFLVLFDSEIQANTELESDFQNTITPKPIFWKII